jgi:hypothetical protein
MNYCTASAKSHVPLDLIDLCVFERTIGALMER